MKREELDELIGWESLGVGGLAKRNPAALRGRLMFAGAGEEFWRLDINS